MNYKIGDIIKGDYSPHIYLFVVEGLSDNNIIISNFLTSCKSSGRKYMTYYVKPEVMDEIKHEQANEDEIFLFKQHCLIDNIWFDTDSNTWIKLKKNQYYHINSNHGEMIIRYKKYKDNYIEADFILYKWFFYDYAVGENLKIIVAEDFKNIRHLTDDEIVKLNNLITKK